MNLLKILKFKLGLKKIMIFLNNFAVSSIYLEMSNEGVRKLSRHKQEIKNILFKYYFVLEYHFMLRIVKHLLFWSILFMVVSAWYNEHLVITKLLFHFFRFSNKCKIFKFNLFNLYLLCFNFEFVFYFIFVF